MTEARLATHEHLHERLAALRRVTVKRGATKAEAETAKLLADQLATRLGKTSRRRQPRGPKAGLPEPPQARRKRLWLIWLEAALAKVGWAGAALHGLWLATLAVLIAGLVFGSEAVRHQLGNLNLIRVLVLLAIAVPLMLCAVLLTFGAWWLRTLPGERRHGAVVWLGENLPLGLIMIVFILVDDTLQRLLGRGWLNILGWAAAVAVAFALSAAWYRWGHPVLQRRLRSGRAS